MKITKEEAGVGLFSKFGNPERIHYRQQKSAILKYQSIPASFVNFNSFKNPVTNIVSLSTIEISDPCSPKLPC